MPKSSSRSINRVLAMSASKKAGMSSSYVTRGYTKFLKTKIHNDRFGSVRIDKLMKKPALEFKKFEEIYEAGQKQGIFSDQYSAKEQFRKAQKEEKKMAIEEQKAKEFEKATTKEEAIGRARKATREWERQRLAAFGGKEELRGGRIEKQEAVRKVERIYEAGKEFREREKAGSLLQKGREREYAVRVKEKGTGSAKEKVNQLLDRVAQEEKKGGKGPANQKTGHQGLELRGMAGIDKLTHPDETMHKEFTGGIFHVAGLDKTPADRPANPFTTKSIPSTKDITDLDIG